MDPLPSYSSIISPPTYEASASLSQRRSESVWPRDYGRQTPRIDVAKFYHDLVLNFPYQDFSEHSDMINDQIKMSGNLPPSPPSSPTLPSSPQTVSSSSSSKSSSEFVFLDHHHTVPELNRLLMQTWRRTEDVPSYEAFKAKVSHCDLRPIPNSPCQAAL